jgi:hypothetical protein
MVAVPACGQTSGDLATKYPVVSAYEVRPGILMTAKYAEDGQACEITLEKRHQTPEKIDLGSTIPRERVKQLIDELVPASEKGQPTKRYLKGAESTIGGGVVDTESEFENVSIQIVGSTSESCDSGDEVVTIRWKKRTCAAPKPSAASSMKPDKHTDAATTTKPAGERTDTVDPKTGNLHLTVPLVATKKPSH